MSQENVEIVKRAQPPGFDTGIDMAQLFRASTTPDPAAVGIDVTAFDNDFEVEFIASQAGTSIRPPPSRGIQGFAEGWRDWLEPWENYHVQLEGYIDADDDVVSLVRVQAKTARDAVPVEHRPAAVWSVREGKIFRVRFYLDRDEALEAAGLRE
jgi:ketosteroid isomerase-like protein